MVRISFDKGLAGAIRIGRWSTRRPGTEFDAIRGLQRIAQVTILQYRWQAVERHGLPALRRAFAVCAANVV